MSAEKPPQRRRRATGESQPAKPATLRDIATRTGLSMATVSYAMRGIHVSVETQAVVREAANVLGYHANPIARALASGRSDSVGVLVTSLADSWQQFIVAELVTALPSIGKHAIIVDAGADPATEEQLAERLIGERVDALVVMSVEPGAARWQQVADATRVIAVGDALPAAATNREVVFDNAFGVSQALSRLAEAGHTNVTVLSGGHPATPDRPVESVARRLARKLHLELDLQTCGNDLPDVARIAGNCLDSDRPPTAFFCIADSIAWGVYAAARERGLVIPEDLSVVGYDGAAVSGLLDPPLSGYRWPIDQLIDAVLETIDETSGKPLPRISIRPEQLDGASVSAPPVSS